MKTIVITGITGFIGSHIGQKLVLDGYKVYALYRTSSSFDKCNHFKNSISWINIDEKDWEQRILNLQVDILIHTAWSGITADSRNNWQLQIENFWFAKKIFDLAVQSNTKQIISLGSQAEYGSFTAYTDETSICFPLEAYGSVKLLTCNYLMSLATSHNIQVQWIRIFTIFGEGEKENMLIPATINKLLNSESINLTECEQEYNYLYIEDFVKYFTFLLQPNVFPSGIYNICNKSPKSIRSLLIQIANRLEKPVDLLKFGALPYRENQNMQIIGNPDKFGSVIGKTLEADITIGLEKTINSIKLKNENF